ncbi:MAG: hypothetical protein JWO22_1941, partial [Frankiales bacterium]|nr:hypothetical protein [Frankiales bacterium]
MRRRRAALPLFAASLLLAGCGLRVDHSTRQALLHNALDERASASAPGSGGTTGDATTGVASTGSGSTGSSIGSSGTA